MFGILRTILALYVVLLHIFSVPVLGNYSISVFFLLSGFLMTYIVQKTYGYNWRGFKIFWLNRFLRLYPIYFVALGLTIIVIYLLPDTVGNPSIYLPKSVLNWFSNLTMLYPNVVPHRINPRVVPTSWALTNELIFYMLISVGISRTRNRTFCWLFISVLYYVGTYLFYDIATYRYSAVPASSLPFEMGATLFWLIKSKPIVKVKLYNVLIVFLLFNCNAILRVYLPPFLMEITIYVNLILAVLLIYLLFITCLINH